MYPNGVLLFTAPSVANATINTTVRIRVPDGHDQIVNHALVTADGVTPTVASLLTNITRWPLNWLRLIKTGPAAVLTNGELVYTLRATNIGSATLQDVTVVYVSAERRLAQQRGPCPRFGNVAYAALVAGQSEPGRDQDDRDHDDRPPCRQHHHQLSHRHSLAERHDADAALDAARQQCSHPERE